MEKERENRKRKRDTDYWVVIAKRVGLLLGNKNAHGYIWEDVR